MWRNKINKLSNVKTIYKQFVPLDNALTFSLSPSPSPSRPASPFPLSLPVAPVTEQRPNRHTYIYSIYIYTCIYSYLYPFGWQDIRLAARLTGTHVVCVARCTDAVSPGDASIVSVSPRWAAAPRQAESENAKEDNAATRTHKCGCPTLAAAWVQPGAGGEGGKHWVGCELAKQPLRLRLRPPFRLHRLP